MLAKELISDEVPPLKISDTGTKALKWMEEFKVSHLPVIKGKEFIGLLADTDLLDLNSTKQTISNLKVNLHPAFVFEHQHVFEVLKVISALHLSVIPVLDIHKNYTGVITAWKLMQIIADMPFVNEPGAIIMLEMNDRDYSMAQIAQIVEGNDAKILSAYITARYDQGKTEVTLKVNREDLAGILQTFSRYNYTIKASFHQSDHDSDMKSRFDAFMNYLNV